MNPFPNILPVGMVIIVALWLLFSHNESEPDNRLPAAASSVCGVATHAVGGDAGYGLLHFRGF